MSDSAGSPVGTDSSTLQAGVRAGIVVTGTEMLTGKIVDRNGPWLAEQLGTLGVEVAYQLSAGDRPEDLMAALRFLRDQRVDLVVTTGGLGPTADDITAQVVASFAGAEMVLDERMERTIAAILARFRHLSQFDADALAEANRKQAMVPRGADTVDPAGTAPGLVVPAPEGPTVIVLPGPPAELQAMWQPALATPTARAVLDRADPFATARIRLFGLPESEIAATLREIGAQLDLTPVEITTCLRKGELEIDIRHRADTKELAERLAAQITDRHVRHLVSTDGSTIDEQVAALLAGRTRAGAGVPRTIALAESCTGGLLAGRLTDLAGASDYVAGGVVAYSNAAKAELLGVDPDLIDRHGAVSPEVARAMADGAIARFGADVGCGVTGVAGPGGGTEAKPVGYVCLCVRTADGKELARDPVLPGNRADVRERSVTAAMHLLRRLLDDTPAQPDPG